MHLVLPVMPWHVLVTPSTAAGVLSAAVVSDHHVSTYYANLKFGERLLALAGSSADPSGRLTADFLTLIADDGYLSGVAEWIFTQALYRDGEHDIAGIAAAAGQLGASLSALRAAHAEAVRFIDDAAADILSMAPDVVGLSTTFAQTTACLALARRLKEIAPALPIVFGGSNCDGPMGAALQRSFPFVDYVVRREGERPLRALLAALSAAPVELPGALLDIPGLCWWQGGIQRVNPEPTSFPTGAELPAIDQTPYFSALEASSLSQHVVPQLILESSRGCWWGQRKHCTFCGLSDLTIGFRSKPGDALTRELLAATRKHQVLDVMTSDNILDTEYFQTVLPQLACAGYDLDIFYELRINLSDDQLRLLAKAGVHHVQPGIESLHSGPLKLMDKGTTGVMNVAALRGFTDHEITAGWNYLVGFPGERDQDYDEVTEQLANIVHLQPPNGAHRIVLERFNPYFDRPELGFERRQPMSWYPTVYPHVPARELEQLAYLFDTDAKGVSQPALERLKSGIETWKAQFAGSSLTHRFTDDRLYLYDRRANRPAADYELSDPLDVAGYQLLATGHSAERLERSMLRNGFEVPPGWGRAFLHDLHAHGLLYTESGRSVHLSTSFHIGRVQFAVAATSAAMASRT